MHAYSQFHQNPRNFSEKESRELFKQLKRSIKKALPLLGSSFDLHTCRTAMNHLAKKHHVHAIGWEKIKYSKYRFSTLNQPSAQDNLSLWISTHSGKPFNTLNLKQITTALMALRKADGFGARLKEYLNKDPNFLFNLIMDSSSTFRKICGSRLSLYLTDQQIALAIIKHLDHFVEDHENPYQQVTTLINNINEILSKGRSVSTLLRNKQAKTILDNSLYFQMSQSDEYLNQDPTIPFLPISESNKLSL